MHKFSPRLTHRNSLIHCDLPSYSVIDQEEIWVFVDDSNIWIEAKKFASHSKNYETTDHRIRISIGGLIKVVGNNRIIGKSKLYGSEPPPNDEVWNKAKLW